MSIITDVYAREKSRLFVAQHLVEHESGAHGSLRKLLLVNTAVNFVTVTNLVVLVLKKLLTT